MYTGFMTRAVEAALLVNGFSEEGKSVVCP